MTLLNWQVPLTGQLQCKSAYLPNQSRILKRHDAASLANGKRSSSFDEVWSLCSNNNLDNADNFEPLSLLTDNNAHDNAAAGEHVEGDGEGVVHQDVAQEDGAEEEVPHPSYWHNGLVR